MKKNGFTLVELISVIVLLGLLMVIAVPNALNLSKKVKEKSYLTKIDLIEQAANNYGQTNVSTIRRGISLKDSTRSYTCKMTYTGDEITSIAYNLVSGGYSETRTMASNEYWCTRIFIDELVKSGNLDWDEEGQCASCNATDKANYNDVVINPATNYIINKCQVFMYFKNNRVYSVFDRETCDIQSSTPYEGREYKALKK